MVSLVCFVAAYTSKRGYSLMDSCTEDFLVSVTFV